MQELVKGVGSVALGTFAGAGLAAISFLAIDVLMSPVIHLTEIQKNLHLPDQSTGLVRTAKTIF